MRTQRSMKCSFSCTHRSIGKGPGFLGFPATQTQPCRGGGVEPRAAARAGRPSRWGHLYDNVYDDAAADAIAGAALASTARQAVPVSATAGGSNANGDDWSIASPHTTSSDPHATFPANGSSRSSVSNTPLQAPVAGSTASSTTDFSGSSWRQPSMATAGSAADWGQVEVMGEWGEPARTRDLHAWARGAALDAGSPQSGTAWADGPQGAGPHPSEPGRGTGPAAPDAELEYRYQVGSSTGPSSGAWQAGSGSSPWPVEEELWGPYGPGRPHPDYCGDTGPQAEAYEEGGGPSGDSGGGDPAGPVPPSDITLILPRDAEALLPVIPTASQARYYRPHNMSERLVTVLASLGLSVALSKAAALAGPALLYPLWGPWLRAGTRNVALYLQQFTALGLWRAQVLEVQVRRIPYAYSRSGLGPAAAATRASGDTISLLVGDPWPGGARASLSFPCMPGCEDVVAGEPAELLVLGNGERGFAAGFRCVREVYLPQSGLWLCEYPFTQRDVFLDISLAVERQRQAAAAAAAPPSGVVDVDLTASDAADWQEGPAAGSWPPASAAMAADIAGSAHDGAAQGDPSAAATFGRPGAQLRFAAGRAGYGLGTGSAMAQDTEQLGSYEAATMAVAPDAVIVGDAVIPAMPAAYGAQSSVPYEPLRSLAGTADPGQGPKSEGFADNPAYVEYSYNWSEWDNMRSTPFGVATSGPDEGGACTSFGARAPAREAPWQNPYADTFGQQCMHPDATGSTGVAAATDGGSTKSSLGGGSARSSGTHVSEVPSCGDGQVPGERGAGVDRSSSWWVTHASSPAPHTSPFPPPPSSWPSLGGGAAVSGNINSNAAQHTAAWQGASATQG